MSFVKHQEKRVHLIMKMIGKLLYLKGSGVNMSSKRLTQSCCT